MSAPRLKLMTILGTRPEIIRLSRVIPACDAAFDHVLVHTGQNYDPRLSAVRGLWSPSDMASLKLVTAESNRPVLR